MSKFKVGDRVRITSLNSLDRLYDSLHVGSTGTVKIINGEKYLPIGVWMDNFYQGHNLLGYVEDGIPYRRDGRFFSEDALELIKSKGYQVGDRVVIVRSSKGKAYVDSAYGRFGTIIEDFSHEREPHFLVQIDDCDGRLGLEYRDNLLYINNYNLRRVESKKQ